MSFLFLKFARKAGKSKGQDVSKSPFLSISQMSVGDFRTRAELQHSRGEVGDKLEHGSRNWGWGWQILRSGKRESLEKNIPWLIKHQVVFLLKNGCGLDEDISYIIISDHMSTFIDSTGDLWWLWYCQLDRIYVMAKEHSTYTITKETTSGDIRVSVSCLHWLRWEGNP